MNFALLLFITIISAKTLPPDIVRCRKSDPNACLDVHVMEAVRKFAAGNKDLGIVPLEPLFIERVEFAAPGSGSVSLHQVYRNAYLHGITSATITDSEANFDDGDCYWRYNSFTPAIRLEADYTMKGRLLLFPINGQGRCNNTFYEIDGRNEFKCEKYVKKDKTHLRMVEHKFRIQPKRVVFDYNNIIGGNEEFNKEVLKTVNENALTVYADVGPALEEVMSRIWLQSINEVFSRVPEDELFLP
ncbi:JHBP domain containing protein [Asbolus verrucosus]|uniref:JHBP domain containing protein n=1 Tax=Asbolus verrucosus TaxID=1661398 RepID=A0A482W7Z0_ASBVE|nr:JHBP domain containing protein [Asbolus verrucosus]